MTDPTLSILESRATSLAELLAIGRDSGDLTPEELADSLDHLLSLPFETALSRLPPGLTAKLGEFATRLHVSTEAEASHVSTFAELFQRSEPPVAVLKFAKEFGKAIQTRGKSTWPAETGAAIYYASLGVALVRLGQRIGRLSNEEMEEGFSKLIAMPWIDGCTKRLFEEARAKLRAG